jgi:hypothetical protein
MAATPDEIDAELVAALAMPAAYPHRPARVEHVQTHISHVFLAGDYVYKLKKAVRFPFLDFTTRAARRHYAAEELRLNRRLAAPVYLDVPSVVRDPDGTVRFLDDADAGEPVLRMRRIPEAALLPRLLAANAVDPTMMPALAERIATFHRTAPTGADVAAHAAPDALQARFAETIAILARFVGTVLRREDHAFVADFGARFVRQHAALLRTRQMEDRIREGHGDLHAEHVCFVTAGAGGADLPPGIYVFDCVEFSLPFRCNDVASEIAFLAMDLEHRGRRDLAEAFVAAYVAAAGDPTIHRLLPYYVAYRACVRAMVACLTSAEDEVDAGERAAAADRARAYFALVVRAAWRAADPMLIVCSGLSGTGKSTLAAVLADATDAIVLRSDVIRKREAAPDYTPAARATVYEALLAEADTALADERTVVADATFLRRADRARAAAVAAARGRRVFFVEAVAAPETVRARLDARRGDDVSDARWETYLVQCQSAEPYGPDEPHVTIATDGTPDEVRAAVLAALATRCFEST